MTDEEDNYFAYNGWLKYLDHESEEIRLKMLGIDIDDIEENKPNQEKDRNDCRRDCRGT